MLYTRNIQMIQTLKIKSKFWLTSVFNKAVGIAVFKSGDPSQNSRKIILSLKYKGT